MEESRNPFVFDEHILKIDYNSDIKKINEKLDGFMFSGKRKKLEKDLDNFIDMQKHVDMEYFGIKTFFEYILNQNYCKVEYLVKTRFQRQLHKVEITGKGIEKMFVYKEPEFIRKNTENKELKITNIPVIIGSRKETITIYEQPQIILPTFSYLLVKYNFNSSFDLGDYLGEEPREFTKNPSENNDRYGVNFFDEHWEHGFKSKLFYGKPGKVFFRGWGDALGQGLKKAIFERKTGEDNEKFNLQVQIYLEKNSQFLYQGNMDNNGPFPFFIIRDDDKRENSLNPLPIELAEVEKK
ncbi:MAG: hypothetical protein AABX88_01890 [Nanoarchaeota archaeon]